MFVAAAPEVAPSRGARGAGAQAQGAAPLAAAGLAHVGPPRRADVAVLHPGRLAGAVTRQEVAVADCRLPHCSRHGHLA